MKRIIVVDGLENTGKTTFCKKMAELYDMDYLHFPSKFLLRKHYNAVTGTGNKSEMLSFLRNLAMEEIYNIKNTKRDIIIDRFVLSSLLYQGSSEINPYIIKMLDGIKAKTNINSFDILVFDYILSLDGRENLTLAQKYNDANQQSIIDKLSYYRDKLRTFFPDERFYFDKKGNREEVLNNRERLVAQIINRWRQNENDK